MASDGTEATIGVTLATTCYNRGEHVKKTLLHNIASCRNDSTEVLLLDYSGHDSDLALWIGCRAQSYIDCGRLTFVRMRNPLPKRWCANHAKNVAAICSRGDIIANVDADNLLAPGFDVETLELLAQPGRFASLPPCAEESLSGRLAMRRDDFVRLGGYDEEMKDWGYTDADLRDRARAIGLQEVRYPKAQVTAGVWHSIEERIEAWTAEKAAASFAMNRERSHRNIEVKNYRPNHGKRWGEATVDVFDHKECETRTVWGR